MQLGMLFVESGASLRESIGVLTLPIVQHHELCRDDCLPACPIGQQDSLTCTRSVSGLRCGNQDGGW